MTDAINVSVFPTQVRIQVNTEGREGKNRTIWSVLVIDIVPPQPIQAGLVVIPVHLTHSTS